MFNSVAGRLRLSRLGRQWGTPNPYGIVGSLESSSRVTISGSGYVTEETVGIPLVCIPDSPIDFKILEELFRCGFGLPDSCYTKNTSESVEWTEIFNSIFQSS